MAAISMSILVHSQMGRRGRTGSKAAHPVYFLNVFLWLPPYYILFTFWPELGHAYLQEKLGKLMFQFYNSILWENKKEGGHEWPLDGQPIVLISTCPALFPNTFSSCPPTPTNWSCHPKSTSINGSLLRFFIMLFSHHGLLKFSHEFSLIPARALPSVRAFSAVHLSSCFGLLLH
jgi:hypothetical protein